MSTPATGPAEGEAAGHVRGFLARYRRRSVTLSLLRLTFFAVAVNEAVRWASIVLNRTYGLRLPVVSPGPELLAVLFVVLLRRWSLPVTARRADAALGFRDRLVSFLDFAVRTDVPPRFREAQAAEAASALAPLGARALPRLRWYLALGPALLLVSMSYPFILAKSSRRGGTQVAFRHPPGTPGTPDAERAAPSGPEGAPPAETAPPAPEAQPEKPAEPSAEPRVDPTLAALPDGSPEQPKEGDAARPPAKDTQQRQGSPLQSFQVGQRLSRVVDPLPARGGGDGRRPVGSGMMSFRLFPATDKKGEGGAAAGSGAQGQAVVDVGAVPQRYRAVVERYFTLLNAGT